ncbi:MAG: Gfo/Idh/MocA family oxidoreductase [Pirellulales bacterium]|nr:Gfo/Idh/MocA family oxidoreductase [Pirellulales bacterium]
MTVRCGIIGCGVISDMHAKALSHHVDAEIMACADLVQKAAQQTAVRFSIPQIYTNPRELLHNGDLDAVVICVPPKWHAEYFLEALAEGKHVLIEKPLAMNLAEADRMVDATMAGNRIVGVALIHRYLPAYRILRDMIRGGAIGRIMHSRISLGCDMYNDTRFRAPDEDPRSWLVDRDVAGGGILMSSSVHFLSAISYVLDNVHIKSVDAKIRRLHGEAFPDIEDDIDLRMELASESEFVLHDSWVANQPFQVDFTGDHGRLTASGPNWSCLKVSGICLGTVPDSYAKNMNGTEFRDGKSHRSDISQSCFDCLIADFIQSINQGVPAVDMPNIIHARNMQAVIDAAYRSGVKGGAEAIHWQFEAAREAQ